MWLIDMWIKILIEIESKQCSRQAFLAWRGLQLYGMARMVSLHYLVYVLKLLGGQRQSSLLLRSLNNTLSFPIMFARSVRRFATTALRAAETVSQMESGNQYGIQVSKAQGHVNGFVGGKLQFHRNI